MQRLHTGRPARPFVLRALLSIALVATCLVAAPRSFGDPVAVRYTEGIVHGFLRLRTLDGSTIAHGDLKQTARNTRVTTQLAFFFNDGSVHEETTVYSQQRTFHLVSHHLAQKGPSFPRPLDMRVDAASGQVTVRYTDDDGESKVESERLDLPPDLANGLVATLLKNVHPGAPLKTVSYVAATPKPRLVRLAITTAGDDSFSTGGGPRKAMHYVLKVQIGGLAGLVAPLVGKQPPDSHVWILGGDVPAFVKSEQTFYTGGPLWRVELASPTWPRDTTKAPASPASR
jgi:hypothetical protein